MEPTQPDAATAPPAAPATSVTQLQAQRPVSRLLLVGLVTIGIAIAALTYENRVLFGVILLVGWLVTLVALHRIGRSAPQ
jgi:energy-converting hydrogenase Eha subunit E